LILLFKLSLLLLNAVSSTQEFPLPISIPTSTEKPSSSSAFPEHISQGQTPTFIAHYADVFNVCPSLRRFSLRPLASCSATVLTSKDMTLATFDRNEVMPFAKVEEEKSRGRYNNWHLMFSLELKRGEKITVMSLNESSLFFVKREARNLANVP
jgi:hypothetical protein